MKKQISAELRPLHFLANMVKKRLKSMLDETVQSMMQEEAIITMISNKCINRNQFPKVPVHGLFGVNVIELCSLQEKCVAYGDDLRSLRRDFPSGVILAIYFLTQNTSGTAYKRQLEKYFPGVKYFEFWEINDDPKKHLLDYMIIENGRNRYRSRQIF